MAAPIQDSWLWATSSSGDGSASGYTQADWTKIAQIFGSCHGNEGVADYANHYSASEELETVLIDTGGALVDGKPHECTTAGSVAVVAAVGGGNTRIDRIILRASWNAADASPNTVRIVNLAGTDAGTPSAPTLTTTTGSTYEIAMWQALVNTAGSITTLTDERNYGDITTACALGANVVTLDKMADNSIDSAQYVDASIDAAHMSASSVDSAQYVDGSIDTSHLANDVVTQAKLGTDTLERVVYPLLGSTIEITNSSPADYAIVDSMAARLDKSDFPTGATVKLSTAIETTDGLVNVRLYDVTGSACVVGASVQQSGAGSAFYQTPDLLSALTAGERLYRVQVAKPDTGNASVMGAYLEVNWS